jgi:putative transposase
MVNKSDQLSIRKQCDLLRINRSNLYYEPVLKNETEIANTIHDIWLRMPFYGYRRITHELKRSGFFINHKRVLRIMQEMNIKALYPRKKYKNERLLHKKYPYLLNSVDIIKPNQVWATDITYIKIMGGFIYLIAIIDWFSRFVLAWRISNNMDIYFCLNVLTDALCKNKPDILNSDQGTQFTSDVWIGSVEKLGIKISMDGKGRWADNIIIERFWRTLKHEHIFLNSYDTINDAKKSIYEFINLYNYERLHQSLNYKTPAEIYFRN